MKKYQSIERHGKRGTHLTVEGNPEIVISEKIDGANSSFRLDDGEILAFSRNTQLDEENNLRGFYEWTQKELDSNQLLSQFTYYGEWTAKHKLDYGDNHNKFYLFDIYDNVNEQYMCHDVIDMEARRLGLSLAPVFYQGQFLSIDHIKSFIGKSYLGEVGEGVVVKNYNYRDRFGKQVFTKFVSDEFAEKMKTKKHNVSEKVDPLTEFIESTLTEARVSKMIHKLVDEGKLHEEYGIEDMGTILKGLGSSVYEDIMKEETDELFKILKRQIGRNVPNKVKQVLASEGKV